MCSTPRISFCGGKSPLSATTRLAMFLARSPMRSRSLANRKAATISRRSIAMGWRRAMVRIAFSSMSRCNWSVVRSAVMTRCARSVSRLASASTASAISFSARPPISATLRAISCRSTSKALAVWSGIVGFLISPPDRASSTEAPSDVVLGAPVTRRGEHFGGRVELDDLAEIHEGGEVGHAGGLLHVVGHDDDRIEGLELVDKLLDLRRRDRIERRAGLVEQDDFGTDRDRAGDAQPLLLTARQAHAVGIEL